jgi:hypothetical protein
MGVNDKDIDPQSRTVDEDFGRHGVSFGEMSRRARAWENMSDAEIVREWEKFANQYPNGRNLRISLGGSAEDINQRRTVFQTLLLETKNTNLNATPREIAEFLRDRGDDKDLKDVNFYARRFEEEFLKWRKQKGLNADGTPIVPVPKTEKPAPTPAAATTPAATPAAPPKDECDGQDEGTGRKKVKLTVETFDPNSKVASLIFGQEIYLDEIEDLRRKITGEVDCDYQLTDDDRLALTSLYGAVKKNGTPEQLAQVAEIMTTLGVEIPKADMDAPPLAPITSAPPPDATITPPAITMTSALAMKGKDNEVIRPASDEVRQMQAYMTAMGVNCGPLDGLEGPKTRGGLKQYIEAHKDDPAFKGKDPSQITMSDVLEHMKAESQTPEMVAKMEAAFKSHDPRVIAAIQTVLKTAGFDVKVDGVVDDKTLNQFQLFKAKFTAAPKTTTPADPAADPAAPPLSREAITQKVESFIDTLTPEQKNLFYATQIDEYRYIARDDDGEMTGAGRRKKTPEHRQRDAAAFEATLTPEQLAAYNQIKDKIGQSSLAFELWDDDVVCITRDKGEDLNGEYDETEATRMYASAQNGGAPAARADFNSASGAAPPAPAAAPGATSSPQNTVGPPVP